VSGRVSECMCECRRVDRRAHEHYCDRAVGKWEMKRVRRLMAGLADRSLQHATCSMQHTTVWLWHAVQRAMHSVQHAPRGMPTASVGAPGGHGQTNLDGCSPMDAPMLDAPHRQHSVAVQTSDDTQHDSRGTHCLFRTGRIGALWQQRVLNPSRAVGLRGWVAHGRTLISARFGARGFGGVCSISISNGKTVAMAVSVRESRAAAVG
jgi:hypothetical protein